MYDKVIKYTVTQLRLYNSLILNIGNKGYKCTIKVV